MCLWWSKIVPGKEDVHMYSLPTSNPTILDISHYLVYLPPHLPLVLYICTIIVLGGTIPYTILDITLVIHKYYMIFLCILWVWYWYYWWYFCNFKYLSSMCYHGFRAMALGHGVIRSNSLQYIGDNNDNNTVIIWIITLKLLIIY